MLLAIYFFRYVGIPGLLEHGGQCGWGWCSPTIFGWVFLAAFVLLCLWLLAWGLASAVYAARRSRSIP